jgi:hypothetical protein
MDAASYTLSIGNQSFDGSGRSVRSTGAGRVVGNSACASTRSTAR